MFRAVGAILILWYLSTLFSNSFRSFDGAFSATMNAIEAAAIVSKEEIEK